MPRKTAQKKKGRPARSRYSVARRRAFGKANGGLAGGLHARKIKRGQKKNPPVFIKRLFIIFVPFMLLLIVFVSVKTRLWDSRGKLTLVSTQENGDVLVSVLDPSASKIINIVVPAETEIEVANQFGIWKVKSIWKLGENEGVSGELLAHSITKNFRFPIMGYLEKARILTGKIGPTSILEIFTLKSDLLIGDKVKILFFAIKLKDSQITNINLENSTYLKETVSLDGEDGYVVRGNIPVELSAIFVDQDVAESNLRVVIINATGGSRTSVMVGENIEVLGARLVAFEKSPKSELDCEVVGVEKRIVEKVISIFGCTKGEGELGGAFDLEIRLGSAFVERF